MGVKKPSGDAHYNLCNEVVGVDGWSANYLLLHRTDYEGFGPISHYPVRLRTIDARREVSRLPFSRNRSPGQHSRGKDAPTSIRSLSKQRVS